VGPRVPTLSEFRSSEIGPPWAVVMTGTPPPAVWCNSPPAPRFGFWSWILAVPGFGAAFFGGLDMGTPGCRGLDLRHRHAGPTPSANRGRGAAFHPISAGPTTNGRFVKSHTTA